MSALRQQVIAAILDTPARRIKLGTVIETLGDQWGVDQVLDIARTLNAMILKGEVTLSDDNYLELGEVRLGA